MGDHNRILAEGNGVLEVSARHRDIDGKGLSVSLLWIILIVILVLALLGFFTRGRW
jgi:flagellar basal body-associated protein FliL